MDDQNLREASVAVAYTVRSLANGRRTWEAHVSAPPGSDSAARTALESTVAYLEELCASEPSEELDTRSKPVAAPKATASTVLVDVRTELLKRVARGVLERDKLLANLPKPHASDELRKLLLEDILRVDNNFHYVKR